MSELKFPIEEFPMLRFCLSVFAVTVLGASAIAEDKKDVPKELLPFQGKWEIKEFGVDPVPPKEKWPIFSFDGVKLLVLQPGTDRKEAATFSVDPDGKPAEFEIRPDIEKEKIVKGIYKFEKETLTMCFTKGGGERPKDFKAEKPHTLLVLVKVKEKQ